jgi:hypothetical protein
MVPLKKNHKDRHFFENVPNFTHLEMTITNPNYEYVQKEIYSTLNVMNSCYPSNQNVLSSLTYYLKMER